MIEVTERCYYMSCKCDDCPCICRLNDKVCVLELGEVCQIWEDEKEMMEKDL